MPNLNLKTPLHLAAETNDTQFTQILLDKSGDCNAMNTFKETQIQVAISRNAFLKIKKKTANDVITE